MARSTYVVEETEDTVLRELWVLYEETVTAEGEPAACLVQVDDALAGAEGIEAFLDAEQRAAIAEEIGLPLAEERYAKCPETGAPVRIAYTRRARRDRVGGKGWVYTPVVHVWRPESGALAEAAEAAGPGEQFALVLSEAAFASGTRTWEALSPEEQRQARRRAEAARGDGRSTERALMSRQEARDALTSGAGTERRVVFVKRSSGKLRSIRFRYDPGKASPERAPFDAEARGLLPVFDLDRGAARFVNLDGVLR